MMESFSFIKPTLDTPYHIDFDWWKNNDRNWRVLLINYLSEEDRANLLGKEEQYIDIIDPKSAEVRQVDALQYLIMHEYARKEGFITPGTPLTEAIFRLFLFNGNTPMTPREIGEKLGKSPQLILQTLSGKHVHQGIRPCQ